MALSSLISKHAENVALSSNAGCCGMSSFGPKCRRFFFASSSICTISSFDLIRWRSSSFIVGGGSCDGNSRKFSIWYEVKLLREAIYFFRLATKKTLANIDSKASTGSNWFNAFDRRNRTLSIKELSQHVSLRCGWNFGISLMMLSLLLRIRIGFIFSLDTCCVTIRKEECCFLPSVLLGNFAKLLIGWSVDQVRKMSWLSLSVIRSYTCNIVARTILPFREVWQAGWLADFPRELAIQRHWLCWISMSRNMDKKYFEISS